ncbi:right-handed parallel beta-helix repeat-containing protein [Leptolyngbya sp. FACHB-261]|uniref:right-handed parallel beta-helix repeat-containing protein n=1 Tax=Leptolyngbya sp. FACHB-261 TaxID=2692806 RepID=UPI001688098D|nr:right-handed parallel beta-helix repeat-containing protein [Leptolyngbya sp. FACHB-261]MBD2101039.1 right-handed parallel beta-helix repeat-containing protein [Leptolyngbya sp. FACHB-261]
MKRQWTTTGFVAATVLLIQQSIGLAASTATVPHQSLHLRVVVNSNQDGPVQPNEGLTLREAIEVVNGTLSIDQLSNFEKAQVELLSAESRSRLEFNLPTTQTTIHLVKELPALASPGLIVDGTTQPGYANTVAIPELATPAPVVAITPAEQAEVFRGLTVVADGITIRGLSLYGFTARHRSTEVTPPADIFISHQLPPPDTSQQQPPGADFPFRGRDIAPKDVVVENNWLGVSPDGRSPSVPSAFGVSIFNSSGTTIQRNQIANHTGSGIITSVQAENLQISNNVIANNGLAGMPDAIRLEGNIRNTQITSNLIQNNSGSAIFLFKPEGSVQIRDNTITFNGRRLNRAAIYLMGNEHEVLNNRISDQIGPGIVAAAYPQTHGNRIQGNQFSRLSGLSIDLVSQYSASSRDYQQGDGPNPLTSSYQQRRQTANLGIEPPQFISPEFFLSQQDDSLALRGSASPGSQVEIYRVGEGGAQGPLTQPLATAEVSDKGEFAITLTMLKAGDRISATATAPRLGTSEPAPNAVVRSLGVN